MLLNYVAGQTDEMRFSNGFLEWLKQQSSGKRLMCAHALSTGL